MVANSKQKQGNKAVVISALARQFRRVMIFAALVIGAGVLVLVLAVAGGSDGSDGNGGAFTVTRGDLTISVTESGDIKALNSIDIKSKVERTTTIISIVDEGTIITPEDVNNDRILVELDSTEIKEDLAEQKIKFLTAQASYTEAKESLDIQKKQNESDIEAGRLKVRFGLMDLQKYLGAVVSEKLMSGATNPAVVRDKITLLIDDPNLGGEALQMLRELSDNITLAESKFEQASDTLMWTEKLYDKQYVAETKLRADQLEVQSLKVQMERARTALELFRLYEFPKEAERLLSDYNEGRRELERIEAGARSKLAQAQAKLDSEEATFALQEELLENKKQQLAACTIGAPAPGEVVYASSMGSVWERRRRPIEIGAEIQERQKIISIPDPSVMKVEVKIHETWVDKVQPGQTAKIDVAAFPEGTFTGEVLKKAPLADPEEWLNPDLKVYSTDIKIDGTHEFLKTGMTAKVEVIIDQLKNVVVVPIQSVINREGKKISYVMTSKGPAAREVETGAFNDNFVEIKSGLREGEQVLLNPGRLVESRSEAK